MQMVVSPLEVAETIRLIQGSLPRMPNTAILAFDQQVYSYFADVMQQGSISDAGGPGICLCGLVNSRERE